MSVSLMAVLRGVKDTLSVASGVETSMGFDQLTEGVPSIDCPRLHIFPQTGSCDPSGRTDRTTFQAGVQQVWLFVIADLFARQRSQLDEDMEATVRLIDALMTTLQEQTRPPFFGVAGIKAFNWSWTRETFTYGDARYMGARFRLNIRVF